MAGRLSRSGLASRGSVDRDSWQQETFKGQSCFYISDVVLLNVSSCGGGGEEL